MKNKVLFLVCELGSAKYCFPLWKLLREEKNSFEWKILAFGRINLNDLSEFADYLIPNYDGSKTFEKNLISLNWNPDLIFSSATYQKLEYEGIKYAQKKNILGIQFIDTWYNYYEKLAKENKKILATKIFMIDKLSCKEAICEGVDEKKLVIIGQPALESIKEKKIKKRKKNILFINQPLAKHKNNVLKHLGYDETDVWKILFQAMSEIRNDFDDFLFAKHPDEDEVKITKKEINDYDLKVIKNGQIGLNNCDTIIGMWSTLMIDAFFLGKDVISIIPEFAKTNNCILSKRKFIPLVKTSTKLIEVLKSDFRYKNKKIKKSLKGSTKRLKDSLKLEIDKFF